MKGLFEQYINGKRENFHSNSPVRHKKKLVGISHYCHCSTMKLLGIFHVSNIRETLRMWELDFSSKNSHIL
jgi:hypothetical protein